MKRFLLIIIVIATFGFVQSQAQFLTKFKAKAGVDRALEHMKSSINMTNPKLQFIGTFNQTIPFGELEIEIEFDFSAGSATGWAYIFVDADNQGAGAGVFLIKPIIGDFLVVDIPALNLDEFDLELGEGIYVGDYNWMDSDLMIKQLNSYEGFSDFYNQYKPFEQIFVVLFAGLNPVNNLTEPLWAISLANNAVTRNCAVQAESGEVFCSEIISSVNDLLLEKFEIYPNPANDFINIKKLSENNLENHCAVYDLFGRELINIQLSNNENSINVSNLAPGVYSLKINNQFYKFIKK